jgi:hypothetical protein
MVTLYQRGHPAGFEAFDVTKHASPPAARRLGDLSGVEPMLRHQSQHL